MAPCACCGRDDGLDPETEDIIARDLARKVLNGEMTPGGAATIASYCAIPFKTYALAMAHEHLKNMEKEPDAAA